MIDIRTKDLDHLPNIEPISDQRHRPRWSVMIPTHNCADYLSFTLAAVLSQDLGPDLMQIEVVDDASTRDDPQAVVQEIGAGRVEFFRQPTNVGATANFNSCIQRARGQLVHILHGDDLVQDSFYERLGTPLLENLKIGAAFCRQIYIDEHNQLLSTSRLEQPSAGILSNPLNHLAITNRIQPPAMVIKRRVYEALGGYNQHLLHSADWEMWVRIASFYPIWYEPEPLALYRIHKGSDTSRLYRSGANMQDRRNCIEICRRYWPPEQAGELFRKAYAYSAIYALRNAYKFLTLRQWHPALIQLRESAFCLGILCRSLFNPGSNL